MWNYSEKVIDHFLHPRNVGEIENADGTGEVGSLACGDMLRLTFKLDKAGRIVDAKFKTFGCASAIASSSALTEMIKGMTLEEAEKITNRDIANYLGGLPEEKMHCSVMGREALEAAIKNYRGISAPKRELEGKVVCKCFGVTENDIRRVAKENDLETVEQVTSYTKAGGGCGLCHEEIEKILNELRAERRHEEKPGIPSGERNVPYEKPAFTNVELVHMVEELINSRIKAALQQDGGDIELVDINRGTIYIRLKGACATCPSATLTMKRFIEKEIQKEISRDLRIEEVK
jgi:NifU-like protein